MAVSHFHHFYVMFFQFFRYFSWSSVPMIAYTLFDTSPLAGGHLSTFISFSSWCSAIIHQVFVVYWDWNCLCTSYRRSCNHMQTTPIVRPLWGLVKSNKSNPYEQKSHWSYPYPIAVHSPGTTRGPGLDLLRRCATSWVFTVAGLPGRHGTGWIVKRWGHNAINSRYMYNIYV